MSQFSGLFIAIGVFCLTACVALDGRRQGAKPAAATDDRVLSSARRRLPGKSAGSIATESETARRTTASRTAQLTDEVITSRPSGADPLTLAMIPKRKRDFETGISGIEFADPTIKLCEEVGKKLGSVSIKECLNQNLVHSAFTISNRSLAFKDYPPLSDRIPLGRVFVIGGIHGDEFSSVSVVMKWMGILDQHHSGLFHWRFVPAANPDGLLKAKSQRQNRNGVDLNRNFPTADWDTHAIAHWEQVTHRNPRRHPGTGRASELETQWLVKQISEFRPDVIISMHAPYHLVDYDGPPSAPEMLGELYLRELGVFPGSLGNYAGIDLKMPIVTVELKSAGIMPAESEINRMWIDLVHWLRVQLSKKRKPDVLNPGLLELTSPG